jgi:hypothetical protein
VDDATRLAYAEVLADEKATSAVGFLKPALAFFVAHGIEVERVMTDNSSAYRSTMHAIACRALRVHHIRTRPYRPQTNSKAERFIRTMLAEWAYAALYGSSAERANAFVATAGRGRYPIRSQSSPDRLGAQTQRNKARDSGGYDGTPIPRTRCTHTSVLSSAARNRRQRTAAPPPNRPTDAPA